MYLLLITTSAFLTYTDLLLQNFHAPCTTPSGKVSMALVDCVPCYATTSVMLLTNLSGTTPRSLKTYLLLLLVCWKHSKRRRHFRAAVCTCGWTLYVTVEYSRQNLSFHGLLSGVKSSSKRMTFPPLNTSPAATLGVLPEAPKRSEQLLVLVALNVDRWRERQRGF